MYVFNHLWLTGGYHGFEHLELGLPRMPFNSQTDLHLRLVQ